jgi:hypothetical protein
VDVWLYEGVSQRLAGTLIDTPVKGGTHVSVQEIKVG